MFAEIPIPPSANRLWRNVRGRMVKAKAYREWLASADVRALRGAKPPVSIVVTIYGGKGFPVNRDIDNVLKAIGDLLRDAGVIDNDSVGYVRDVRAIYRPPISSTAVAKCVVEVTEVL